MLSWGSEIFQAIKSWLLFYSLNAYKNESFTPKKANEVTINEVIIGKLQSLINFDLIDQIVIKSSPAVAIIYLLLERAILLYKYLAFTSSSDCLSSYEFNLLILIKLSSHTDIN